MKRVCRLGTVSVGQGLRNASVYVEIKYEDGTLSITGVEGPLPSGGALGGCGQINMHLRPNQFKTLATGWTRAKIRKLLDIWDRWHLNDLVPGTPKQMELIRAKQAEITDPLHKEAPHAYAYKMGFNSYYDMELAWLENAGLVKDDEYKFGSAWLKEEIPQDVIEWLNALPEADKRPAWV